MAIKYIIVQTAQEDKFMSRVLPSTGLTIGEPRREPEGAPGGPQRSAWAHDFSEQDILDIQEIGRVNGMVVADLIKDTLPADWRR